MPFVSDAGIGLLGSKVIDMKTAATTTIYTTPAGKTTRLAYVLVRDPTASLAGGTSYTITSFRATFSLAALTGVTSYIWVYANDLTQYADIVASTAVQLTVTTGSTLAANATVEVYGTTT